jgi:DNA-binding transcriptional ArsR family regulator
MSNGNILILESRREIYNFILRYPGLHLREISRRLTIPFSTLNYHLRFLKKRELIKEKAEGRYNRYYITEKVGSREKEILSILRKDTPRTIILYLLAHIYSSQIDISGSLKKHPTTIEFHLKKLLNFNIIEPVQPVNGKIYRDTNPKIIECDPIGKERIYVLKDPDAIYDTLTTYKHSLLEDIESNLVLAYLDSFTKDLPEKLPSPKEWEDLVIETFFEIFPHPYHV